MRKRRNSTNYKITKAVTNAGSAALATAPSGNPFLIGGTAAVAGFAGAMQEPRDFDPNPFRRSLDTWSRGVRRRGRRVAREVGDRSSSRMAARGIGGSELAASITSGAERASMQHAEDLISERTAQVEDNIAHAELYVDEANRAEMNRDWQGLASAAITAGHDWVDRLGTEEGNIPTGVDQQPELRDLPMDKGGGEPLPERERKPPARRQPDRREPPPERGGTQPEEVVPEAPPRDRNPFLPEDTNPFVPDDEIIPERTPPATEAPPVQGDAVTGQGGSGSSRAGKLPEIERDGDTEGSGGGTGGADTESPEFTDPRFGEGEGGESQGGSRREIIESDPVDEGGEASGRGRIEGSGRDDQIHPEEAPKDRRPIDPPELPEEIKLDENSTYNDVQEFFQVAQIQPDSRLGKMVMAAPDQFGILVQSFGVTWLKDIFTFA